MNYIKEILVNLVRSTMMTKFADLDQAEKRRISFEKNRKAIFILPFAGFVTSFCF